MKIQSLFTFSALSLFSASVYASGISEANIIEAQKNGAKALLKSVKSKPMVVITPKRQKN